MDTRLEEIKARVQAATPGPWDTNARTTTVYGTPVHAPHGCTGRDLGPHVGNIFGWENAQFIAHARSDVDYLTARLTVLEGEWDKIVELTQEPDGCWERDNMLVALRSIRNLAYATHARAALGAER